MKILAIISKNLEKASTYYRLTQYLPLLKSNGFEVDLLTRDSLNDVVVKMAGEVDLVLNLRCLINLSVSKTQHFRWIPQSCVH